MYGPEALHTIRMAAGGTIRGRTRDAAALQRQWIKRWSLDPWATFREVHSGSVIHQFLETRSLKSDIKNSE